MSLWIYRRINYILKFRYIIEKNSIVNFIINFLEIFILCDKYIIFLCMVFFFIFFYVKYCVLLIVKNEYYYVNYNVRYC